MPKVISTLELQKIAYADNAKIYGIVYSEYMDVYSTCCGLSDYASNIIGYKPGNFGCEFLGGWTAYELSTRNHTPVIIVIGRFPLHPQLGMNISKRLVDKYDWAMWNLEYVYGFSRSIEKAVKRELMYCLLDEIVDGKPNVNHNLDNSVYPFLAQYVMRMVAKENL